MELDLIVPRRRALREYLFVSPQTAALREKTDPTWPQPIPIGAKRFGYRMSSIREFIEAKVAAAPRREQH
jgi:predicted DNA-binding transcriptional regulator AlpA